MPEENPTPTPADVAAQQQGSAAATPEPAAPPEPKPETPPWGEDFDPEKAWNLVKNLRADKEKLQQRPALTDEQKTKLTEFDRLEQASKTELQRAQEAATREADRAKALLSRAVKSEVKALAQGFADPDDAAAFLDLSKYATGDGDVDSDSIKADLADLLQRKAHLAKQPETRLSAPNPAQGSSASGSGVLPQLTEQEVSRMYREKDYDGIEKARSEGRLNAVLGIQ
jgi:hypothetical protein